MTSPSHYRKVHNLILISRLLNCRDGTSPMTLVLDSLRQSASQLLIEIIHRAKKSNTSVIFLSFETLKPPGSTESVRVIKCNGKQPQQIQKEISALVTTGRRVIIVDSLHPLLESRSSNVAEFLSSLMSPTSNVIAVCHADVPFTLQSSYAPEPLALLKYLATTILTVYSLTHVLAQKRAKDKSLAEPAFGLEEEIPGLLIGLGSNDARGIVIEMNHRRRSGRSIQDWFFLWNQSELTSHDNMSKGKKTTDGVILLQDHPEYPSMESSVVDESQPESTFSLGVTEKEKSDRDAISLPYFDAQKGDGIGDGGRILYDLGEEDDFDEEEDEI